MLDGSNHEVPGSPELTSWCEMLEISIVRKVELSVPGSDGLTCMPLQGKRLDDLDEEALQPGVTSYIIIDGV
jgi:hypothetical protein